MVRSFQRSFTSSEESSPPATCRQFCCRWSALYTRIVECQLLGCQFGNKRGNTYVEFETSVRGVQLKPGDIITLTYLKEGFQRQPFRIRSISPGDNFGTAAIVEQYVEGRELYVGVLGNDRLEAGRLSFWQVSTCFGSFLRHC